MSTLLKTVNFDGYNGSHFYISLYYDLIEQSIANNTSKVRFNLYVGSTGGYSASGSSSSAYINDGYVGSITSIGVNAWQWVGSRDIIYTHNQDGTLTNAWYGAGLYTNWSGVGGAGMGGYFSLPKINRYAMITTANAFTDEENPSMQFTNNLMYDLRAKLKVGNEVIYNQDLSDNTVTSYTFELTNAQRKRLRELCTSSTLSTTFEIVSLENGTEKYTSSKAVQMNLINANPTLTYSVVETNAKVISALGSSSASNIIDNASTLKFTITPTAYKEATIAIVSVTTDEKTYTITTSPYEISVPVTTNTFIIKVTDNRNLSATPVIDNQRTLIPYEPLLINDYSFKRENPVSSNVILNLDLSYYNSFGSVSNTPVVKWKLEDGNYNTIPSSNYVIDSTNNKLTISNYEITNILDYQSIGQFTIYAEDKLTTVEDTGKRGQVLKGIATFDAGEFDFQINGDFYLANISRTNKVNAGQVIRENEKHILYDDETGSQGVNISLGSLDWTNYSKIAIVYNKMYTTYIDTDYYDGSNFSVSFFWHDSSGGAGTFGAWYSLNNNNELEFKYARRFYFYTWDAKPTIDTNNAITINKVIGYK